MDKKKVYLIYEIFGEYEDYNEYLLKAFFDKNKAEKFKQQKEEYVEKLKERYKKCCHCNQNDEHCKLYKKSESKYWNCENYITYNDIDGLHYELREIEVE